MREERGANDCLSFAMATSAFYSATPDSPRDVPVSFVGILLQMGPIPSRVGDPVEKGMTRVHLMVSSDIVCSGALIRYPAIILRPGPLRTPPRLS